MHNKAALGIEVEDLTRRRVLMAVLAVSIAASLLQLGWYVLSAGGWTVLQALIFLCLAASVPWLGLTAATAIIGMWIRLTQSHLTRDVLIETIITSRTVIAVCVRLEDMAAVLPPLDLLMRELHAVNNLFSLAILSDTPDGLAAQSEWAAVAGLIAGHKENAIIYRRRAQNTGFKAGNLMEFLDQSAERFDWVLVMDADSVMSSTTVLKLVRMMQADPTLAIVQPTVAGHSAASAFASIFGFGHRHSVRIWATGQAWWQGAQGPYWGHNALVRIAPFRMHCRLPLLPDGSSILSHDHVEAALLHAAGWAVRVLPDDTGSAERHPPDLAALLDRDLRWAMGNMQYRHLLLRSDLGRVGRFQMLQAILHYALAPLWFAMLPLAALNVATGGGVQTPSSTLLILLATGFLALNLPKLGGYAEVLVQASGARSNLLRQMGKELLFGLLVDSVAAADRTVMVLRLAFRLRKDWHPQKREANHVTWSAALHRFGPHTIFGMLLLLGFAQGSWFSLFVALPILAGLLLAVPLYVLTAQPIILSHHQASNHVHRSVEAVGIEPMSG